MFRVDDIIDFVCFSAANSATNVLITVRPGATAALT